MPAFKFDPKFTTITATSTLPGGRSFTVTLTALAKTTISGATIFPPGIAVSGAVVLPVFGEDCDNGDGHSRGQTKIPRGQAKKGKTVCPPDPSSNGSTSPPPSPPPTATSPSSIQPPPTSTDVDASQSAQESSSASTDPSTSTGGQPRLSTQSSARQNTPTGPIVTSSPGLSLSTSLAASSASVVSAANPSTPPTATTPSPTQPSSESATPAPGLSAGSAVGIALGVFAAAGILVAAAVFLFLFLRKRKRRRKRESAADSTKRQLTSWAEDTPSRPLSSTWSWFGSLPIASEPDHAHEHEHGTNPYISSDLGPRTGMPPHDPTHAQSVSPIAPPVHWVDHAFASASAHAQAPQPEPEDGAAHLLALATMDYSASRLPPTAPPTAQSRAVDDLDLGPWDMPRNVGRDNNGGAQGPRDPFADPRVSGISRKSTSMATSSAEVASVEAL